VCLFNGNNLATSEVLPDVFALLNATLVILQIGPLSSTAHGMFKSGCD